MGETQGPAVDRAAPEPRPFRRGLVALPIVVLLLAVAASVAVGVALSMHDRTYIAFACGGDDVEELLQGSASEDGYVSAYTISCDDDGSVALGAPFVPPDEGVPDDMAQNEPSRRVTGTVRSFDAEEGWGVITSPSTPGGAFVGFSDIEMEGYRELTPGQQVTFVVERPMGGQDGYVFRAEQVRVEQVRVE